MRFTASELSDIIAPLLDQEREFLVEVTLSADNQICVVVDSDEAVTLERCIQLSRAIEAELDRDREDFSLEVASASLSDPFSSWRQYRKHIGHPVSVVLPTGERIDGELAGATPEQFTLLYQVMVEAPDGRRKKRRYEDMTRTFTYSEVKKTTYRFSK